MRFLYLTSFIAMLMLSGCGSEDDAKSTTTEGRDTVAFRSEIDYQSEEQSISSNSFKDKNDSVKNSINYLDANNTLVQTTTLDNQPNPNIERNQSTHANSNNSLPTTNVSSPIQRSTLRNLVLSAVRVSKDNCSNAKVFSLYHPMNSIKANIFDHGTLRPVDYSKFNISVTQSSNPSNSKSMNMGGMRKEFSGDCLPVTFQGSAEIYPAFRISATDGDTTLEHPITLYKSDEKNCKVCHASNSFDNARPSKGLANLSDSESDFKTNILRLHDQKHPNAVRDNIKNLTNYDTAGLEASARNTTVRCTDCHKVNAVSGSGIKGISVLTNALHAVHAEIVDPYKVNIRSCITCHPGFNITPRFGSKIMHTRGKKWIDDHDKFTEDGGAKDCKLCHGYNYQGTKMSKTQSALSFGVVNYRAGDKVSCFDCHTNTKWDLKPSIGD